MTWNYKPMCNICATPNSNCRCSGRRQPGFFLPRLLLLLSKKAAHGYELLEALREGDQAGIDPGNLYRTLRGLEEEGLVCSTWDTDNPGPARRVYQLTSQGIEQMHAQAAGLYNTRQRLDQFLADYQHCFPYQSKGDEK
jgi:PadR family transcriptional regulator, regulatory protein PadR